MRVLVVGGGLAGSVAALSAQAGGAEVVRVARGTGASALSSGALEVGRDPAEPRAQLALPRSLPDVAAELGARQPNHPYAVLRAHLAEIPAALRFLQRALDPLLGPPSDREFRSGRFANHWGLARTAALVQVTQQGGELVPGRRYAVAWFPAQPAFLDGDQVAALLRASGWAAESLPLDLLLREDQLTLSAFALAATLEQPGVATELGASIRRGLPSGCERVLLPAILGVLRSRQLMAEVVASAGVRCAELLAALPSIPGLRLHLALQDALAQASIPCVAATVTSLEPGRALLEGGGVLEFDRAVLATGRYLGGGIQRGERFEEPLCGLPVSDGSLELFEQPIETLLGDGPGAGSAAFRAGLRADGALRPLGADGQSVPWLHIAGSILAGSDPAVDGAGLGLSAFTGFLAGRLAAGLS
jgi:glycerol-3-phosphate dehydrogenase subunit B